MFRPKRNDSIPPCVYLVADHLDAALAAGEDLVAAGETWQPGDCCDPSVTGAQRWTLSRVMTYEMALITRIVQAREHVTELAGEAQQFRPLAQLFVSATRDLYEALDLIGDTAANDFDTGDGRTAYLRSRGLIDPDAPGLGDFASLSTNDTFLVAGQVPLGVVLDLVSEFFEALEGQFELYPEEPDLEAGDSASELFAVMDQEGSVAPAPSVSEEAREPVI